MNTITLPFKTPHDIQIAVQFVAALRQNLGDFTADAFQDVLTITLL